MTRTGIIRTVTRWVGQLGLPLLAAVALFVGVLATGRFLAPLLRGTNAYTLSLENCEWDLPEGLSQDEFLQEVQYLAGLPDHLDLQDKAWSRELASAIARHPLVEKVEEIRLGTANTARIRLRFRQPVLRVEGLERAVDSHGILLPRSAWRPDLPLLTTPVTPPSNPPGEVWPDVRVEACAEVMGLVLPRLRQLQAGAVSVSIQKGEVTLQGSPWRIVWGHPPRQESPDEASAASKVQRLNAIPRLDEGEVDLRPLHPKAP